MLKKQIETDQAPEAIGTYSQAIKAGNVVYLSGQIPLDPQTMELVDTDFARQTQQVLTNLSEVAKAAGGSLQEIVKLTVYLTDLSLFNEVNQVMQQNFNSPYPARAVVEVSALPRQAQIEMDAIMHVD